MASLVIENRVLAGVRFEDIATGTTVRLPLDVRGAPGGVPLTTYTNRRSIHVVSGAEGLEEYVASFSAPPAAPPVGDVSLTLEVRDPSGTYLPREFSIAVPRTIDRTLPDSVYELVSVPLLRSPLAGRSRNWAMIRIRLNAGATSDGVPAALVRVVQDPTGAREILGWGMSVVADPRAREIERRRAGGPRWTHFDPRHVGEASVPVVGLSGQVWSVDPGDDVILTDIAAALEVVPMTLPAAGRLPDPDDFFAAAVAAGNSRDISLSVGGDVIAAPFAVDL